MDRTESDRLWAHVQTLLRQPEPPDDPQLRRAARMLASARSDAVELLLAQWLARSRGAAGAVAAAEAAPGETEEPSQHAPQPAVGARQAPRLGWREAALVTAGVAGGALLVGLTPDNPDLDLDLG